MSTSWSERGSSSELPDASSRRDSGETTDAQAFNTNRTRLRNESLARLYATDDPWELRNALSGADMEAVALALTNPSLTSTLRDNFARDYADKVRILQEWLITKNLLPPGTQGLGTFGPKTKTALLQYRTQFGNSWPREPSPATWPTSPPSVGSSPETLPVSWSLLGIAEKIANTPWLSISTIERKQYFDRFQGECTQALASGDNHASTYQDFFRDPRIHNLVKVARSNNAVETEHLLVYGLIRPAILKGYGSISAAEDDYKRMQQSSRTQRTNRQR